MLTNIHKIISCTKSKGLGIITTDKLIYIITTSPATHLVTLCSRVNDRSIVLQRKLSKHDDHWCIFQVSLTNTPPQPTKLRSYCSPMCSGISAKQKTLWLIREHGLWKNLMEKLEVAISLTSGFHKSIMKWNKPLKILEDYSTPFPSTNRRILPIGRICPKLTETPSLSVHPQPPLFPWKANPSNSAAVDVLSI